ncbi:aspartic proteinase CDR1-like [Neltuma alba]|uniref:aspartic proteinase CDR1-like n=1 Tax=Neltuma alba TaxID=207710 RepID=UPI0010A411F7|nr:aspartic proteinase CDR1-like [Prosopis alba]
MDFMGELYGDDLSTEGIISHDTFTVATTSGGNVGFQRFVFGCSEQTEGTFNPYASGIVGFGRGPASLTLQIRSSMEGKFAYCLAPDYDDQSSTMLFGQSAVVSGSDVVSTPLVVKVPRSLYFVTLEAISVGDKRIALTTGYYSIDLSRPLLTWITFCGGRKYAAGLRHKSDNVPAEFLHLMEEELTPHLDGENDRVDVPDRMGYAVEHIEDIIMPRIVVHFRGADVELEEANVFDFIEGGIACVSFRPMITHPTYGAMA